MSRQPSTCTWKNFRRECWTAIRSSGQAAGRRLLGNQPSRCGKLMGIKDMKTKKMNQNILHNRSVKFGLLFLGLAMVMSGCAVGPNYKRPTVNTPATRSEEHTSELQSRE